MSPSHHALACNPSATLLAAVTLMSPAIAAVDSPAPAVNPALAEHQAAFGKPRVIQVTERVFVAYAYTMSNIIMVVGDRGVAIFDTGFRVEEARAALEALREKSDKRIVAVVYSHGHADHTGGSRAFAPANAEPPVRVYAQASYRRYLADMHSATRPVFTRRAVAQLGMILPKGESGTVGSGGGPVVRFSGTLSYAPPTDIVEERKTIDLGGVTLKLFRAPGDLDDALAAWIPEEHVLLAGDTAVGTHTYPILSTPRYEKGRDARAYVETLSRMRDYRAEVLVGGHGAPIVGAAAVADLLERTELVAQFMIDETMRLIRRGLSGEEVAAAVSVPAVLRGGQEFGDYYHRLRWIVRGIYDKEMGWYGGDVLELVAHPPVARAHHFVEALGGRDRLLDRAEGAYRSGDASWAVELATLLLEIDSHDESAIDLKAKALEAIAYASESANERNSLLTEARILSGDLGWRVIARGAVNRLQAAIFGPTVPESALAAPSLTFIQNMGPLLSTERALAADQRVEVRVSDRGEVYRLRVRNGVLLREREGAAQPEAIVEVSHRALVLATEGLSAWSELMDAGLVEVRRGDAAFERFLAYFDW